MNLFGMLQISGSALLAERERAELSASNLANAETTRTIEGGPYRRQNVVFAARHPISTGFAATLASFTDLHAQGVQVAGVFQDLSAPVRRYDPGHPDADATGYVGDDSIGNHDCPVSWPVREAFHGEFNSRIAGTGFRSGDIPRCRWLRRAI